jgi:hypothetical protein
MNFVSWDLSVVLICVSFIAREVEHFFMCLLAIWLPLRIPCLMHVSISSLGCWFFGELSFWVHCRFWIFVPCQMSSWQRFSPILSAVSWVWWLFLLLCRSSLVLCSPICSLFLLDAQPFEFSLWSCSLYLSVPVYFLLLPVVVSKFQPLYEGLWSTLSWFWYRATDRDLVSVFCMWISSFPSNICWRGCLSSIVCLGLLCQRSVSCSCVGSCLRLLFCSTDLFFGPVQKWYNSTDHILLGRASHSQIWSKRRKDWLRFSVREVTENCIRFTR